MKDDPEFGEKMYPDVDITLDPLKITGSKNLIELQDTEIGTSFYLFHPEMRAFARRYYEVYAAELAELPEVKALVEAAKKLKLASEMRRDWDISNKEEFNEMYPDIDGWAFGDVDENFIQGMEAIAAALAPFKKKE